MTTAIVILMSMWFLGRLMMPAVEELKRPDYSPTTGDLFALVLFVTGGVGACVVFLAAVVVQINKE